MEDEVGTELSRSILNEHFCFGHNRCKYDFVHFLLLIKARNESHLYRIPLGSFKRSEEAVYYPNLSEEI